MATNVYTGLVAKVLAFGDVREKPFHLDDEHNYLADGFGLGHVPDLIRILEDNELAEWDSDAPEAWAQCHAWRILGQLRAVQAIVPLLNLLRYVDERDDDWVRDEVPVILAFIGADSLQPAADFLADTKNGLWSRIAAVATIEAIGNDYAEARSRCVQIVSQQLEQFAEQDEILNASLVDCLVELKAVEAAPLMERAFAAGYVDLTLRGDWEEIQIDLGLLKERLTPKRNWVAEALFGPGWLGADDDDGEDEWADEDEEDDEDQPALAEPRVVRQVVVDPAKKKRKRKEAQKQRKAQRRKKKK